MRFFLDENFPKSSVALLTRLGHEVAGVHSSGLLGSDDAIVFAEAQDRKAVILTTDRDFYHTIPHIASHHYGVVVVALHQPNRQALLSRVEWFLEHFKGMDLRDRIFEIRDHTYVVYSRSPSESENS